MATDPSQFGRSVGESLRRAARPAVETYGREKVEQWKALIGKPVVRTGKTIRRSAPGEPPRRDSGRLQTSLKSRSSATGSRITATFGTDVEYGAFLESGTSRMKPRPHAVVIFERATADVVRRLSELMPTVI